MQRIELADVGGAEQQRDGAPESGTVEITVRLGGRTVRVHGRIEPDGAGPSRDDWLRRLMTGS